MNSGEPALPTSESTRSRFGRATPEARTRKMLLCSLLVLPGVSLPAIGADAVHKHKVLEHATVTMTIASPNDDRRSGAAPHDYSSPHRLAVVLRDVKTAAAITGAQVQADVAERGYAGAKYVLATDTIEGIPGYSTEVPMPGRVPYRILIHIRLPRIDRMLEAQFDYRHHH